MTLVYVHCFDLSLPVVFVSPQLTILQLSSLLKQADSNRRKLTLIVSSFIHLTMCHLLCVTYVAMTALYCSDMNNTGTVVLVFLRTPTVCERPVVLLVTVGAPKHPHIDANYVKFDDFT